MPLIWRVSRLPHPSPSLALARLGFLQSLAPLRGADRVFCVDQVPERVSLAKDLGAIPINFLTGKPMNKSGNYVESAYIQARRPWTGQAPRLMRWDFRPWIKAIRP